MGLPDHHILLDDSRLQLRLLYFLQSNKGSAEHPPYIAISYYYLIKSYHSKYSDTVLEIAT